VLRQLLLGVALQSQVVVALVVVVVVGCVRAIVLLLVVVGLLGAVEWMVESLLVGLLWLPALPLRLCLQVMEVDMVDPRARSHHQIMTRRCRHLVSTPHRYMVAAPTTTLQIPTAMGAAWSPLKPVPSLSSL